MKPLETSRLRLREMEAEKDAPFMLAILNDPAFIRNVADRGVRTPEAAANYLVEKIIPSYARFGFGLWLAESRDTGVPIGICGLIKRETLDDVDVGFSFAETFRGRGLASEAARAAVDYAEKVLRLTRIIAITAPFNVESIRLLERLGLRYEKMIVLPPENIELNLYSKTLQPERATVK